MKLIKVSLFSLIFMLGIFTLYSTSHKVSAATQNIHTQAKIERQPYCLVGYGWGAPTTNQKMWDKFYTPPHHSR